MTTILFAGELPTITVPDDNQLAESFRSYVSNSKNCVGTAVSKDQAIAVDFRDVIAITVGNPPQDVKCCTTKIQFKGKPALREFDFPCNAFSASSPDFPTTHFRQLQTGEREERFLCFDNTRTNKFAHLTGGGLYYVAIDLRAAVYVEIPLTSA